MAFCGASAPGHHGPKSLSVRVLQRLATTVSFDGVVPVYWDQLLEAVSQAYDGDIVMIDSPVFVFTSTEPLEKGGADDGWKRSRA